MSPVTRMRLALTTGGVILLGGGLAMVASPFLNIWNRVNHDNSGISGWQTTGSQALTGAAHGAAPAGSAAATIQPAPQCSPGGGPADSYALVRFTSLPQYSYVGVAANGDWNSLVDHSMVHWHGSPPPGGAGNVIIAFHRETNYEHIDQLGVGGEVTIEDRTCHTYTYRVAQRWELTPDKVTQLSPTAGHDLTLITCTPWWQDYHRLVWRGTLVATDGRSV